MGNLGNFWTAADWQNATELWLSTQAYNHRQIIFRKFTGYETKGPSTLPDQQFRAKKYKTRAEHVWLSQVKVFDTVKAGYFTTGDLDINTTFRVQGYSAAYTLPSGVTVPEYGGDEIVWNGKVWVVADQVEPVQFGYQGAQVWWRTVLRRVDRAGVGNTIGP